MTNGSADGAAGTDPDGGATDDRTEARGNRNGTTDVAETEARGDRNGTTGETETEHLDRIDADCGCAEVWEALTEYRRDRTGEGGGPTGDDDGE